jgi:replicative DNA helicase
MPNAFAESTRDQLLERPLPHSAESERAILGAIVLDNGLVNQAIELLKPEDFYVQSHRRIFEAMIALSERGAEINPIILGEELKRDGMLEQSGGISFITGLTYGLPHFTNILHYAKLVHGKSILRQLVKAANKITSEALEEEDEPEIILDRAEQAIFALAEQRTKQGFAHVKPVADSILEKVQEMAGRSAMLTGLTTGFTELDTMTSGLQASDLVIVAARPSMGKCLAFDSEILLSDGSLATIEAIYKTRSAHLLTLGNNFKFELTYPSNYVDDGIKPVYKVTTRLGRTIECTLSHPFLTIDGWLPLKELKVGERLAVPRILNIFGSGEMRECEVKLLGYLLGDGSLTKSSPTFVVGKPAIQSDFESAITEFGGVEVVPSWLQELGIYSCNNHKKVIPSIVFTLRRDLLALFLNRLFATAGLTTLLNTGQVQLGFASVSEKLARQVQHLLLRFGVIASLKKRAVKYKNTYRTSWQLDITDARSIRTFINEIGIYGKAIILEKILKVISSKRYQTNREYTNIHVGKRVLSKEQLNLLATVLESQPLYQLATSDIYWDEIVSIESTGNKQVYDLTIPDTHNFVANDICVHNTSLCLTLAQNAAIQAQAVVGVFSLEMSKESLVMRMLCSEGRVDAHRFRSGFLSKDEWARLAGALGILADARIYIDDTPGISVLEMRAKARRLAAEQKKLDLIIVDYLQLMSGSSRRSESRQQEVSQISRDLKGLAKELNVPLIALSQLSRAPEARSDHRPQLSDLRESGSIEQDADLVAFIYREEQYNRTEENEGVAELIIAKQRNGPTGTVNLAFLKEFTRFENLWRE